MDEIKRSLAQLYEAKEMIAEALHHLADACMTHDPIARSMVVDAVHELADQIEEVD